MRLLFFEAVGMICFSYLLYSGIKFGFGRKWIGIDNSDIAIKVSMNKINNIENDLFRVNTKYELIDIESDYNYNKKQSITEVFV